MVKNASQNQKEELKRIWKHEFHDTEEYLNQFMSVHFASQNVYVNMHEQEITSVVYLIPAHCYHDGRYRKAYYIFAVTTQQAFRGHHYFEKILQVIIKDKGKDSVYFLIPEPDVIPYYVNCGFAKFSPNQPMRDDQPMSDTQRLSSVYPVKRNTSYSTLSDFHEVWADGNIAAVSAAASDAANEADIAAQYKKIRDHRFRREGYISWSRKAIQFALWDARKDGCSLCFFTIGRTHHLLLARQQNENSKKVLLIQETTLSKMELDRHQEEIMRYFGCEKLICRKNTGMLYCKEENETIRKETIYLNLGLDG